MSEQKVLQALGKLQEDPDYEVAWVTLQDAVTDPESTGMTPEQMLGLFANARKQHAFLREDEAVARLLELETVIAMGMPQEASLQAELAHVLNDILDDVVRAIPVLERLVRLQPDNTQAATKLAVIRDEQDRWSSLFNELIQSASRMQANPEAQAGILFTAAQMAYRYGLGGDDETELRNRIVELLEKAFELAPGRQETAWLLERLYRAESRWAEVARVLETLALETNDSDAKVTSLVRLGRLMAMQLNDQERSLSAYQQVLKLSPAHDEALRVLVEHFNRTEEWPALIAMYEEALKAQLNPGKENEMYLQIAMVHWRMRNNADAAEPYFEKIRRVSPAHPAVLAFFREYLIARNEQNRLVQILTEALRALNEGPERQSVVTELAKLSEETQGAAKAIEHWRQVLRNDANNQEARESLKKLYYRTEAWPQLLELIRYQLERLQPTDVQRIPLLKEVVVLHREKTKQDAALVQVLNQLAQLDPQDLDIVREQVRVFEALNRPRDWIVAQSKLAELEPNATVRAELWRTIARQWLDKFSNVQNALEAYEQLFNCKPEDEEAIAKLRELYTKRRAYKPLYELLAKTRVQLKREERHAVTLEMAKIAAERLDLGAEAIALYWEIVRENPSMLSVLDALEKQAERDKNYQALAEVFEHRIEHTDQEEAKLKLLEKLGSLYESRLKNSDKTIDTWRRVLDLRPNYAKALRILRDEYIERGEFDALVDVYTQQADFEGLAEALKSAVERTEDTALKVDLSWRIASIFVEKMQKPERAAYAYECILSIEPNAIAAAKALASIFESQSQWSRLPAVYKVLLQGATSDHEKIIVLTRLRELNEGPLQNAAGAFEFASRIYALEPTEPNRIELERTARSANSFESYVRCLRDRVKALSNAVEARQERRLLECEIAQVLTQELGKTDEAIAELQRAIHEAPDDEQTILALDTILRQARRYQELRELYLLRISKTTDDDSKIELLLECAQLEEDALHNAKQALEHYLNVLELSSTHRIALRAVSRLYASFGQFEKAAASLEQERDASIETERAELEVQLAEIYLNKLDRSEDALNAAIRALAIEAHYQRAIEVLESLEKIPAHSSIAAFHLEQEYAAIKAYSRQVLMLERLLESNTNSAQRKELFDRLIDVYEHSIHDEDMAFQVYVRAVQEYATDLRLWDSLTELANKLSRLNIVVDVYASVLAKPQDSLPLEFQRELCERASVLLEEKLSDSEGAIPYLLRILEQSPDDAQAFVRLKQIFIARERWNELQEMYDRTIECISEPHRKLELLTELALIFEDILEDLARAALVYERIVAIEPSHVQTLRALDKIYTHTERWAELAKLLETHWLEASFADPQNTKQRLALLYLDSLNDLSRALRYASEVLESEPNHLDAQNIVRAIIERTASKTLRVQAAKVLEQVYLLHDQVLELDEITSLRLRDDDEMSHDERVALWRRLWNIRSERIHNDVRAFDALAQLVVLVPDDVDVRQALVEVGLRLDAFVQITETLNAAVHKTNDVRVQADILFELASMYRSRDIEQAEWTYLQILEIKEGASIDVLRSSLKALQEIYETRSQYKNLVDILKLEIEYEEDPFVRAEMYGRLGSLCEEQLHDFESAINAWNARLKLDEFDAQALEVLDRLYTATKNYPHLVEILRQRERSVEEPEVRRLLLRRLAQLLAEPMQNISDAVTVYRTLIDDFGPDLIDLTALSVLYEKTNSYREWAETTEQKLELIVDPQERVELLATLGTLRMAHLDSFAEGIAAYRDALMLDPQHAPIRRALERLLDVTEVKAEAAALLKPLYEAEGLTQALLRVLEIQADTASNDEERLEILSHAVRIAEESVGDLRRALNLASQALELAASTEQAHAWFEHVDRIATALHQFGELTEILRRVEPNLLDDETKLLLVLRIADVSRSSLHDATIARTYYEKALELDAENKIALAALEELYEKGHEATALLDILKRQIEIELDTSKRIALLFKQARVSEEQLEDKQGAIEALEHLILIAHVPPRKAFVELERLYSQTERWSDELSILERQLGLSMLDEQGQNTQRAEVDIHYNIGLVAFTHLHDIEQAFEAFRAALLIEPSYAPVLQQLESLISDEQVRVRAAELLEPVYTHQKDFHNVLRLLEVRLFDAQEHADRQAIYTQMARLYEQELQMQHKAFEAYARWFAEDYSDETTWSELERLATGHKLEKDLLNVYQKTLAKIEHDDLISIPLVVRAGALAEQLDDFAQALILFQRAYAFDHAEVSNFEAVDRLHQKLNHVDERIALYRDAIDFRIEPSERVQLLRTIAQLYREQKHDDASAIEALRELLILDEHDVSALDTLEELLRKNERYRELADVLEQRANTEQDAEKSAHYRLLLGEILDTKLDEPLRAIDCYEQIVHVFPNHVGAIRALESMLERPELKSRVVEVLRPIYEGVADWNRLITLNHERFAIASDVSEKTSVLREIANLWEHQGHDVRQAFQAMQQAWQLDPEDFSLRAEVDRLAALLNDWASLVEIYERNIAKIETPLQAELLRELIVIHDQKRDDPRKVFEAFERLHPLEPTDTELLDQSERFATMLGDWNALNTILEKKAHANFDAIEQAESWRKLGALRSEILEVYESAIQAYEQAFELEPDHVQTLDALIALHEMQNHGARLVELYQRRIDVSTSDEDDLRYALCIKQAQCAEHDVQDISAAIASLKAALDVRPSDPIASTQLERLYELEKMWFELLEVMQARVLSLADASERVSLQKRIAALQAKELGDAEAALGVYEDILSEVAYDSEVVEAIQNLAEQEASLRVRAADILEPVLKNAGRYEDLVRILEMRLNSQDDAFERSRTLQTMASIQENYDKSAARTAWLRAVSEAPEDHELHQQLERILQAESGSKGWDEYANMLDTRASAIVDAELACSLFMRLARIAEEHQRDFKRAAHALVRAIEQVGDRSELLAHLDRVYTQMGEHHSLADVLSRRIELETETSQRVELRNRLATIQIQEFGNKHDGIVTLQAALEEDPQYEPSRHQLEALLNDTQFFDEVAEALEPMYRALGLFDALVRLYEKRIEQSALRERTRIRLDLAHILEKDAHDLNAAQRQLEQALKEEPSEFEPFVELERILPLTGQWAEASNAMASILNNHASLNRDVAREMWMKIALWRHEHLHDNQGAEEAYVHVLEYDPESHDILNTLELLQRAPGRERERIATMRRLAAVEVSFDRKRELLREAYTLASSTLNEMELAEAILRELLREDEGNAWALEQLTAISDTLKRYDEKFNVLVKRIELATSSSEHAQLLYEAALVAKNNLNVPEQAIDLFRELLDANEGDLSNVVAARELRTLYLETEQPGALADLLQRLIDNSASISERSQLRLELAKLFRDSLQRTDDAIEVLRVVLDEEPSQTEATLQLSALYESLKKHEDLAELLVTQVERAVANNDVSSELVLRVRLAEVYAQHLNALDQAIELYQKVLEHDPKNIEALSALTRIYEEQGELDLCAQTMLRWVNETLSAELAFKLAALYLSLHDDAAYEQIVQRARTFAEQAGQPELATRARKDLQAYYLRKESWRELALIMVAEADASTDLKEKVNYLRQAADLYSQKCSSPAEATSILEQASALMPDDRSLLLALCDAFSMSSRSQDAIAALRKIIESFGGKRSKELAVYHQRLAFALHAHNEREAALQELELAFRMDPSNILVLRDLGKLALEMNDLERAQKSFRALLLQKLDASSGISKGEVFFYLGEISEKQGEAGKAYQMYERAVESDPSLTEARERVAALKASGMSLRPPTSSAPPRKLNE